MDSESNYDIIPVNNSCSGVVNKNIIVTSPGSQTSNSNQNITTVNNQSENDTQYDNVDNINIKPLYGGKLKNLTIKKLSNKKNINLSVFTIKFRNKLVNIESSDEESAIKILLNNRIFNKDNLLEIIYKNKSSVYIIKNGYKNKFKKIN
jgi:hypothetical protein